MISHMRQEYACLQTATVIHFAARGINRYSLASGMNTRMDIHFTPSVYEHAAALIGETPWRVSRDPECLFRAHAEAFRRYRHSPVVVGIRPVKGRAFKPRNDARLLTATVIFTRDETTQGRTSPWNILNTIESTGPAGCAQPF